jgi:hypothetical protein
MIEIEYLTDEYDNPSFIFTYKNIVIHMDDYKMEKCTHFDEISNTCMYEHYTSGNLIIWGFLNKSSGQRIGPLVIRRLTATYTYHFDMVWWFENQSQLYYKSNMHKWVDEFQCEINFEQITRKYAHDTKLYQLFMKYYGEMMEYIKK